MGHEDLEIEILRGFGDRDFEEDLRIEVFGGDLGIKILGGFGDTDFEGIWGWRFWELLG